MSRSLHPLLLWHRWSLSLQTMNSSHAASFEEDGECKQLQPRLLLPLPTTSPSSSGASSSAWQLVVPEGFKEGVPAFDIADVVVDAAPPLLASGSLPPRPSLRNFSEGIHLEGSYGVLALQFSFSAGAQKPPILSRLCRGNLQSLELRCSDLGRALTSTAALSTRENPSPCHALQEQQSTQLFPSFPRLDSSLRTPKPVPILPAT